MLVQASVSVKRIDSFLQSEELDLYVERSSSAEGDEAKGAVLTVEQGTFSWASGQSYFVAKSTALWKVPNAWKQYVFSLF